MAGLRAENLTLTAPAGSFKLQNLEIGFSWLSLIQGQLRLAAVDCSKGFGENRWAGPDAAEETFLPLLARLRTGLVPALTAAPGLKPLRVSWQEVSWRLSGLPGRRGPLLLENLRGSWQRASANQSQIFSLSAGLDGGRLELRLTRYLAAGADGVAAERIDLNLEARGLEFAGGGELDFVVGGRPFTLSLNQAIFTWEPMATPGVGCASTPACWRATITGAAATWRRPDSAAGL